MKKYIIYLSTFLMLITQLKGDPVTHIQQGVKNNALGNTGAAYYSDVVSMLYNPALLMWHNKNTLSFGYSYDQNEVKSLNANYLRWLDKKIVLGLNFFYYHPNYEDVTDLEGEMIKQIGQKVHIFNSSISTVLHNRLNGGFNVKVINNNNDDDSYNALSIDTGITYIPFPKAKRLTVGLNLMNLLSTTGKLDGENIKEPFNLKTGLGYLFNIKKNNFLLTADFNSKKNYFPQYGFGLEYNYNKLIYLRTGYNEDSEFSAGSGFIIQPFDINYSFENQNKKIQTHRVAVTYYFGRELDSDMIENYYNKGIMYYNDFNFKKSYQYFSALYDYDRYYRETEYYYELLRKRIEMDEQLQEKRLIEAEELYQEAVGFYKKKESTKAINKLIECIKKNKNHQDAKQLLTRIRIKERDRVNKEKSKIREKEGDYYFLMADYPAALLEYEEAYELNPDNDALNDKIDKTRNELDKMDIESVSVKLFKEGEMFYKNKEYSKAIAKWKEVLAINPDFTKAKVNIQKAEETVQNMNDSRLMQRVLKDKIRNLEKAGNYRYRMGDYSQALFKAEELLELDPNNANARNLKQKALNKMNAQKNLDRQKRREQEKKHLSRGIDYYKKGKTDKALYHLAMVVSLNPKKGRAMKELNVVLSKMAKFESTGISKDSPNYKLVDSHYERGLKFYKRKEYDKAASEWKRVMKILPQNSRYQEQLADAEKMAQKGKEQKLASFHLKRAKRFLKENKKSLALAEAKRVLAVLPENYHAIDIVKQCLKGTDNESAIKKHLKQAEDLADDDKFQEAVNELKLILIIDPQNKMAKKKIQEYEGKLKSVEKENQIKHHLDLAMKYYSNENFTDARTSAEKVLELDKNNTKAKHLLDEISSKDVDKDLTQMEKKKIIELYNEGVSLYLDEKYEKCISVMKKIVSRQPDHMRALKFIDKAKQKIKQKSTEKMAKKGKKIDKKLVWKHYLKGINYYTSGDINNAIKEWQRAIALDPENRKIKQSLERAYAKKAVLE